MMRILLALAMLLAMVAPKVGAQGLVMVPAAVRPGAVVAAKPGVLKGTARHADGRPAGGVTVETYVVTGGRVLTRTTTRTGAEGRFAIRLPGSFGSPDASLAVLLLARSRTGGMDEVGVRELNTPTDRLDLVLAPTATLRVRFTLDGSPVAGLRAFPAVLVSNPATGGWHARIPREVASRWQAKTDAEGRAVLAGLPAGIRVLLSLDDDRFQRAPLMAVVPEPGSKEPETGLTLARGATIEGSVVYDATGKPATGVTVMASVPSYGAYAPGNGATAVTGPDGRYRLTGLGESSFHVCLPLTSGKDTGWTAPAVGGIPTHAGATVTVPTLRLVHGGVLTLHVVYDGSGKPAAGVYLNVHGPAHPAESFPSGVSTDAAGVARIRQPAGTTQVYAVLGTERNRQVAVILREGQQATARLSLPEPHPTRPVDGLVLDANGKPVQGATVLAISSNPFPKAQAITDADGRFHFSPAETSGAVRLFARLGDAAVEAGVLAQESKPNELRLKPGVLASLSGSATDSEGSPVRVGTAMLFRWRGGEGEGERSAPLDGTGTFRFDDLYSNETYSVSVTADGFASDSSGTTPLAPGQKLVLPAIHLTRADASVEGTVVDADGNPVAGAMVRPEAEDTEKGTLTDEFGHFRLTAVARGRSSLTAIHGNAWGRATVNGGDLLVRIQLEAPRKAEQSRSNGPEALLGQPAPELHPTRWLNSKPMTLAGLRGKIVVIDFWSTGCGPCVAMLPDVQRLWKDYRGNPKVQFIALCAADAPAGVRRLLTQHHITLPVAIDAEAKGQPAFGTSFRAYRVNAIPQAAVIAPDGKIAFVGQLEGAEGAVAALLAKKGP